MFTPKDFRIPFSKESPTVAIFDQVLYIPPTCDRSNYVFPGWFSSEIFGREREDNPIAIEFCSGNGGWVLQKAQKHPELNWVAVEKRFDRVRKIWLKMKNMNLKNVFIVFGDALAFSSSYIPTSSVHSLYINFPDPWPKSRHIKNRIISPLFFSEASRIILPRGKLVFVTDDASYSNWFLEQYTLWNKECFHLLSEHSLSVSEPPIDYGSSFFEDLFRRQGKSILYHERVRTHASFQNIACNIPTSGMLSMNAYTLTH